MGNVDVEARRAMSLLRYESPTGERRPWTLKEIVQGKPIGHPSHAMVVHFPVAFYIGALSFDIASRIGHLPQAPVAATWLILGAFAGSALAIPTGLVYWWGMRPRSRTRRVANRHLLFQSLAAAFFIANLIVRWGHRERAQAEAAWIVLGAIGVVALVIGQYFGGIIVYKIGFRVTTSGGAAPRVAASEQHKPEQEKPAATRQTDTAT